jgi:alkanesulfonate monooxygenase SsuD/methylene tetrahydromethanopterin reductase-like flavin-dependent oxidoreductase (luciferase family)
MKISWFHLMPYRWLPADFRERYRSVWVDLPNALYDPIRGHGLYNEYLDMLEYAGEVGFDAIGVNEHHQNAYGMMPSPNLMAAALARRTTNAMLLVLGNSIALYNPPVRVAEEMAMLDVMSGGRLIAGFPVGTSMDINYSYGQNPATVREKYREGHDLIIKSWASPEPFAWNGKFTKLRYVNVWPQPIQKPHPPVWIPGLGSIETWDWCVDHAYNYSYLSFSGYKRAQKMLEGYWDRLVQRGAEANPYSCAFFQQVCISDTDAACEREWWPHVDYFFNKCLHLYPGTSEAPGYRSEASLRAGVVGQVGNTNQNMGRNKTWKELVDQRYIVAGSPATVRQQLEELTHSLRVGHLLLGLHIGSAPIELTNRSTYLCATEVLPHLRPLWPEYEDHWWPRPLPVAERVAAGDYNERVRAAAERPFKGSSHGGHEHPAKGARPEVQP